MGMYGLLKPVSETELADLKANNAVAAALMGEHGVLDLDKAWQALHFTLTGDAWGGDGPLADAVMGGDAVAGSDLCYGPARYLPPSRVRAVAAALAALSPEAFAARFDTEALNREEVYPTIWDEGPEVGEYVFSFYETLREGYAGAAEAGQGMLLAIV